MSTDLDKIAKSGHRICAVLDEIKSPDYMGGPYRLIHTDIYGTPNYYANGTFMSEDTLRELLEVFAENPHQHHQTYTCIPHLPDKNMSLDIA